MNIVNRTLHAYVNSNLMMRILLGLIIGASLALLVPNITVMTILGRLFIGALKAIAPVLVALLVTSAIAKSRTGLGKRFRTLHHQHTDSRRGGCACLSSISHCHHSTRYGKLRWRSTGHSCRCVSQNCRRHNVQPYNRHCQCFIP